MAEAVKRLLSIVEQGGYPLYDTIYKQAGYQVTMVESMRKAVASIKKKLPDVIVAEFNFQSDFRDRTSSLETLLASIQKYPDTRVVVFYDRENTDKLNRLLAAREVHTTLAYPIDEDALLSALS
jgi:CheY-like chemotaxis protein